ANLRQVEALVHVVRAFENASVPHPNGSVDPLRDAELVETELIIADLMVVEKRLGKLDAEIQRKKGPEKTIAEAEKKLLKKFNEELSNERPLRQLALTEEEDKLIKGFTFLSQKPLLIVANINEDDIGKDKVPAIEKLKPFADKRGMPLLAFCAKTEMEIAQ